MRAAWLLSVAMVGCTGPTEETTPGITDGLLPVDSAPPAYDGWIPQSFGVQAAFAVDAGEGTLRTYFEDGEELSPYVALRLFDATLDQECTVFLVIDDTKSVALETWTFEDATEGVDNQAMRHIGFTVPNAARVVPVGCEDVSPSVMPDPGALVSSKLWGVGAGNLRTDIQEILEDPKDGLGDSKWGELHEAGQVAGGSWISDVWTPSTWASHIVSAGQLSPEGERLLDKEGWPAFPIPEKDVSGAIGSLPSGHYFLSGVFLFPVDRYLLGNK